MKVDPEGFVAQPPENCACGRPLAQKVLISDPKVKDFPEYLKKKIQIMDTCDQLDIPELNAVFTDITVAYDGGTWADEPGHRWYSGMHTSATRGLNWDGKLLFVLFHFQLLGNWFRLRYNGTFCLNELD